MATKKFRPTWATRSRPLNAAGAPSDDDGSLRPPPPATNAQSYNTAAATADRPIFYSPQPPPRRRRRGCCCSCLIFTGVILLIVIILAAIAAAVLYFIYDPQKPTFSIASFHIDELNLSSPAEFSSDLFLSVSAHNHNSKIRFSYDRFSVFVFSFSSNVPIAAGRLPAFVQPAEKVKALDGSVTDKGLSVDSSDISALKSAIKREKGLDLGVQMKAGAGVKIGTFNSKKFFMVRVLCYGIHASADSNGNFVGSVKTRDVKCHVKLRFRIWRWNIWR